jgi:NADH-quinone oxidoreductase subunit N
VNEFAVPQLDYAALLPMLVLFGAACLGVLAEAFVPRRFRAPVQAGLAMLALAVSLVTVVLAAGTQTITAGGALAIDGPALFLQGSIAILGLASVLLLADRSGGASGVSHTEVYPLAVFSLGGMMLFVASNDLLVMFVALEVLSLPLYLLCGLARRRRLLSQEAAVKYFLLGAFASAFFLYGLALLYGYADSVRLADLYHAVSTSDRNDVLLLAGLALLLIGLLFKAGAAPFHMWTPDVYQGAPTPVTALMAACTKIAAFGAILRVLYVGFLNTRWDWRPVLIAIAIATMIVGAILAVTQTDIKRLLAYSSVANAGFILCGVLGLEQSGISSSLFYLAAYGFTVVGAFAVVMLVRDGDAEATHLARWAGLGRRSPLVAGVFTLFLLAFAGIPLTSGFTSKFAVFSAALDGGAVSLVVVGVIASMVLAFPYLRVIVLMYLSDPVPDGPTVTVPGAFASASLALGVAATFVLGVVPGPVLDLAGRAAEFVR